MSRLTGHYSSGVDFLERLAVAYDAPGLTDSDLQFLADIESKFDQWGERMFFSDAQAGYLDSLAERGADTDDSEDEEFEVISVDRLGKRRRNTV